MIVPMKKAHLVVLKEEKEKLFKSLQRYGELMIISESEGQNSTVYEDSMLNKTNQTIKLLNKYRENKPLFGDYNVVDYNDFSNKKDESLVMLDEIEKCENLINNLKNENASLFEEIKMYEPWKRLEIRLSELKKSKMAKIHLGYVESKYLDSFTNLMNEYNNICDIFEKNRNGVAVFFVNYFEEDNEILEKLKQINYFEIVLPEKDQFVFEVLDELNEKIEMNNTQIEIKNKELSEYSKSITDVEILNDQLLNDKVLKETPYIPTANTVYIEGWVRSDRIERFTESVKKGAEVYDLEFSDPAPDDVVPTYTKNNKFVSPFESITDMFSKPNSKELDPNPVMSVWYWILFGMMMADAGYGLLMIIGVLVLKKLMKPVGKAANLYNIILYSAIPTMIWGVVFGSYFGYSIPGIPYWFAPMDDAITMLLVSVAVGGLHIITGLIVKAVSNFRDHAYFDILSDQLSWILILCGIALLFVPSLKQVAIVMCIVGVALIVLLHGRHKRGIIGKFFSGVLGLYDITSYMSDLLSYSRIMALAMSSASVAMVMNKLAEMVSGGVVGTIFSIIIYAVGHVFNLVLGLLSAYVHDSRLQYIEFFGKFYEGGGVDFQPLSIKSKYIKEIKDENK